MYSINSRVRYSEVDSKRNMTVSALLNYFQDCCTFQSEDLKVGIDFLAERHSAWMLIAWQVVVNRRPTLGENITIHTWPYDFGGFYGYRNFTMENECKECLAYANSVWAYIDTETGRPCKVPQDVVEMYPMEPRLEMEYANRKITLPKEYQAEKPFEVHPSQIDTNHHVNNERYVEMAQLYLPKELELAQLRADYRKSAVLGDTIYPFVTKEQNKMTVTLADEAGKPFVVIEFLGK